MAIAEITFKNVAAPGSPPPEHKSPFQPDAGLKSPPPRDDGGSCKRGRRDATTVSDIRHHDERRGHVRVARREVRLAAKKPSGWTLAASGLNTPRVTIVTIVMAYGMWLAKRAAPMFANISSPRACSTSSSSVISGDGRRFMPHSFVDTSRRKGL